MRDDPTRTSVCQDGKHKQCKGWDIRDPRHLARYGGLKNPPKVVRNICRCPCHIVWW